MEQIWKNAINICLSQQGDVLTWNKLQLIMFHPCQASLKTQDPPSELILV